jgi:hypothetical protein
MREALKLFKNSTEDQQNPRNQNEDTIQEFLQLLKVKHSIDRLLDLLNICGNIKMVRNQPRMQNTSLITTKIVIHESTWILRE